MAGGLLAFALAGAAQGAGQSIVDQAKAKRELALEELRNSRLLDRENKDREFTASQNQIQRDFTAEQNDLNRVDAAKRAEADRYRMLTPDEIKAMGLDESKRYQISGDQKITEVGGGGTTVNVGDKYGKPPSGFSFAYDDKGEPILDERGVPKLYPMQGGPEDTSLQDDAKLRDRANDAATLQQSVNAVREVMNTANTPVFGTMSRPFAVFSGSAAGKARSYLKQITSGVALDAMMRLKEASSQGATGFGALNEKELEILVSKMGALDPDTTDPQIITETLDNIQRVIDQVKTTVPPDKIKEWGLDALVGSEDKAGKTDMVGVPADVDPRDWEYMTPEQKALFQTPETTRSTAPQSAPANDLQNPNLTGDKAQKRDAVASLATKLLLLPDGDPQEASIVAQLQQLGALGDGPYTLSNAVKAKVRRIQGGQ